jgi:choline dehydrogenase-like flavoprotein
MLVNPSASESRSLLAVAANTTFVVPAGYAISGLIVENTTANAVTGGVRVGTTDGGTDVVAALSVGANAMTFVTDAAMLKRFFSRTANQTLYLQAVVVWNSAVLNMWFVLVKLV